jgi:hypothetical protein
MIEYKKRAKNEIQRPSLKGNNYCPRMYARAKCKHRSSVQTKVWISGYVIIQAMYVAGVADGKKLSKTPWKFVPDTDFFIIGLDNHTTCCMELNSRNFVTKLTATPNIRVRGVGNQLIPSKGREAVMWKVEDDAGITREILHPGTLHIPELEMCLMSPPSWCQSANNFPKRDGKWHYQTAANFMMEWEQPKFRRTVLWDRRTNARRLQSVPGTKHYRAFAAVHDSQQECSKHEHVVHEAAHTIPDDRTEATCDCSQGRLSAEAEEDTPPRMYRPDEEENLTDFFTEGEAPTIILDDKSEILAASRPQAELLR